MPEVYIKVILCFLKSYDTPYIYMYIYILHKNKRANLLCIYLLILKCNTTNVTFKY